MLTAEKNRAYLAARPIQKRVQTHITWIESEAYQYGSVHDHASESGMARERRGLAECAGRGPHADHEALRQSFRTGTLTRKEVAA
ncbi:MAG: hypothetical protein OEZ41_13495 [Nitrospirota bacterium]|nr:hypothetical protein [Nitrospirota bacterium]